MRAKPAVAVLLGVIGMTTSVSADAQTTLRGRVIDQNQRPVSFAQVELVGGDRRVVADERGDFSIGAPAPGRYELRVRRIGYEPAHVAVRVPFDEPSLTVTLVALPRLLDSVRIRERGPIVRYTGVVLDDFDQPVVNARVIAAGASDLGVRTDSSGHFRLAKAQKGTMVLRVRKPGYAPYFGSLTLRSEREDTLRMRRLAQGLPEAVVMAESGFGRDTFAYAEMDSRMRWNRVTGAFASREDLDRWADLDLCRALMRTPAGAKMEMRERDCGGAACVLEDGLRPLIRPLDAYRAAEVEAVEIHRRDQTGTLGSRIGLMCGRGVTSSRFTGGIVVWMRRPR
ncbi:MAG: carboxypeptidase regulatory-like domain-containing protein [Gemmatimonadaceae bacterium]|nr:carboxypeptidase regulatory-like domain-containing protein [Gemmatimonadaceae bacterium]